MTLDIKQPEFWKLDKVDAELRRVYDICAGCRRCLPLCPSFKVLFGRLDVDAVDGDVEKLPAADVKEVVDLCYQCKLCYNHCPYTPPHRWQVDFPRLMLRARSAEARQKGVTLQQLQSYLRAHDLALIVSRDVTRRDRADRQQPFNLEVTGGGASTIVTGGKVYDLAFLQIVQAEGEQPALHPIPQTPRARVVAPEHGLIRLRLKLEDARLRRGVRFHGAVAVEVVRCDVQDRGDVRRDRHLIQLKR